MCCSGSCQSDQLPCGGPTSHTCRFSIAGTADNSGNLLVGNTYTFTDTHFEGNTTQDLSAVVSGQDCWRSSSNPNFLTNRLFWYNSSTPLWPNPTWIPAQAGTYTLYCLTSQSGSFKCTGHRCLKNDGTLETTDICGANSHMTVIVVPTPSPTPTPLPHPPLLLFLAHQILPLPAGVRAILFNCRGMRFRELPHTR